MSELKRLKEVSSSMRKTNRKLLLSLLILALGIAIVSTVSAVGYLGSSHQWNKGYDSHQWNKGDFKHGHQGYWNYPYKFHYWNYPYKCYYWNYPYKCYWSPYYNWLPLV